MHRGRSREPRHHPRPDEASRAADDEAFVRDLEYRDRDYEPYGRQGYGVPTYHGLGSTPRPYEEWSMRAFTPVQELPEGISGREQFLRRMEPSAGGFDPPFYGEDDEPRPPAASAASTHDRHGPWPSDARLFDDVRHALVTCPAIDVGAVHLRIEHGEAILSGSVRAPHDKRIAGEIASRVRGVRAVYNELRVPLRRG